MMGPWMMQGYGFPLFGGAIMLLSWLLIIGGVILLIVWLVRRTSIAPMALSGSAIEILKARYAKGEITKEQFEEMRKAIGA